MEAATRRSQIPAQLDGLDNNITALREALTRLEARLGDVLRPEATSDSMPKMNEENPPAFVPLAGELARLNNRLCVFVSEVDSLGKRIEL